MELSENFCKNCPSLQATEQTYQDFISKLSHEVRSPLTLISSSLQLLEKECPELRDNSLWPQIRCDVASVIQLLRDVSSLNRRKQLCCKMISISDFLESIAASFSAELRNRQILFSFDCSPSTKQISVFADEIRLREALTNLLINAADAVNSCSSKQGKIFLYCTAERDMICIRVRDNGCGIPEEYLDTLFDPFVTHKAGGTGLGLNVVKTVAQQHGGNISVRSKISGSDTYTEFCLRIPLCHS